MPVESKFPPEKIREMRKDQIANGLTEQQVSDKYGIGKSTWGKLKKARGTYKTKVKRKYTKRAKTAGFFDVKTNDAPPHGKLVTVLVCAPENLKSVLVEIHGNY